MNKAPSLSKHIPRLLETPPSVSQLTRQPRFLPAPVLPSSEIHFTHSFPPSLARDPVTSHVARLFLVLSWALFNKGYYCMGIVWQLFNFTKVVKVALK